MRSEYKRDVHNNYLVLENDGKVEETSYPVRMLLANALPMLLSCRIQRMDGKELFYYEITSRQSMEAFYEKKKFTFSDLQVIFGNFTELVEKMAEYLLSPDQLVLQPEFIFMDPEKKQLSFCYLPGYEGSVREQFRALTEYILPKLDHEDSRAVVLGYGIYRRALEDVFQLEHIKEEVLRAEAESPDMDLPVKKAQQRAEEDLWKREEELFSDSGKPEILKEKPERRKEKGSRKKKEKEPGGIRKWVPLIAGCIFTVLLLMGAILARYLGYLPAIKVEMLIAAGIFTACLIVLLGYVIPDDGEPLERTLPEEYIQPEKTERTEEEVPVERRNVGLKRYSRIPSGEYGETVILSSEPVRGPATLVSREPGELATIYLQEELTLVGKMETAADAVIDLPTVSRLHAKIRKKGEDYFLSDLNSRNGTAVNGRMLRADEEYLLQEEDQVDFAQARYIFLK